MKTKQELFNDAYLGVIKQGKPSYVRKKDNFGEEINYCRYRGPDGLKCAIGHIISDENYTPFIDEADKSASSTEVMDVISKGGYYAKDARDAMFLAALQQCHDGSLTETLFSYRKKYDGNDGAFLERFKRKAMEFAKEYGLTVPES